MKYTSFSLIVILTIVIGCSHLQDVKRIPGSVTEETKTKLPCGLKGSIGKRIKDCSSQSNSSNEKFILVTRSLDFKEVHKDLSTGLLWSDALRSSKDHLSAEKACSGNLKEVAGISDMKWRLPSIEEYKVSDKNGIRKALPNMTHWFWSSTLDPWDYEFALLFNGLTGEIENYNRRFDHFGFVRCVSRE